MRSYFTSFQRGAVEIEILFAHTLVLLHGHNLQFKDDVFFFNNDDFFFLSNNLRSILYYNEYF